MSTHRTAALLALTVLLGGATPTATPAPADTFTITVIGVRNSTGVVAVALFGDESAPGFPDAEPLRTTSALASSAGVELTFDALPAGRYALAVIHDENENGEMDTNDYGLPVEGFGFSNNVMGEMGPPSFSQASVTVEGDTSTSVSMIYMGEG